MSKRVFVDTNAILPAVQLKQWNLLCGHFSVETVSAVVEETQRGDVNRRGYIAVERKTLIQTLKKVHEPSKADVAHFRVQTLEHKLELDDGEFDLLAYILRNEKPSPNTLILTLADRAAVRACCTFGWGDSIISLETLLKEAGAPAAALRQLQEHFTQHWLTSVRTAHMLKLVK